MSHIHEHPEPYNPPARSSSWSPTHTILQLGDNLCYNPTLYDEKFADFQLIRPQIEERKRETLKAALKDRKWGDFSAIFRPIMFSGQEMVPWDSELIDLLPSSVKVFAGAGAGYDTIDVEALARRGIVYTNCATSGSEAVSDAALFHILSTFRNFGWSVSAARTGDPEKWQHASDHVTETAHNPRGRVLGIVGLGSIGTLIARKAHAAFGMKIRYHDVVRKSPQLEDELGRAEFCENLEELVGDCDCVVLACQYSGKKLITKETLGKFWKGTRLVNVARGQLVDEEALADALERRDIFAAGLDVFEREPAINPRLVAMDRYVMLTCHNAGDAVETHVDFERLCVENVARVLKGQESLTGVNVHLIEKG